MRAVRFAMMVPACRWSKRSNLWGLRYSLERLVCDEPVCDVSDKPFVPSCVREGAAWNVWSARGRFATFQTDCSFQAACGRVQVGTIGSRVSVRACRMVACRPWRAAVWRAWRARTESAQSVGCWMRIEQDGFRTGVRAALRDWIRSFRGGVGLDWLSLWRCASGLLILWPVRTGAVRFAMMVSACRWSKRSNLWGLRYSLERLVCDGLVCNASDGLFAPSCAWEGAGWNDWSARGRFVTFQMGRSFQAACGRGQVERLVHACRPRRAVV